MLTETEEAAAAVDEAQAVVESYSADVEEEYLDALQQPLDAALSSLLVDAAATASASNFESGVSDTQVTSWLSLFGFEPIAGSSIAAEELAEAQAASSDAEELVAAGVGIDSTNSSETTSSDTSIFDDGADLAGISDGLLNAALSGSERAESASASTSAARRSWQPFVLPDDVVFEEVHLPLEAFAEDLLLAEPDSTASFTNVTVTETLATETIFPDSPPEGGDPGDPIGTHTVTTQLTVTLLQTIVDADDWVVSQSWSKKYQITDVYAAASAGGSAASSAFSTAAPSSTAPGTVTTSVTTFSITVNSIGGVVTSSVNYSATDTQTTTIADSWNNSSPGTGMVDTGSYLGTSTATATVSLATTESPVTLPDGSPGRTTQMNYSGMKFTSLSFYGEYDYFETTGTVLDGAGNPTNASSHPYGAPLSPRNNGPVIDQDSFLTGIGPTMPIGGNGTRVSAHGDIELSAEVTTGFWLIGSATVPDDQEIEESDISGTTGFFFDADQSATVNDSLNYDSQTSSGTVGLNNAEYDYLSLAWSTSLTNTSAAGLAMAVSLTDADLPPSSTSTTPAAPSGSAPSTAGSASATSTSGPTPGSPVISFGYERTNDGEVTLSLQYDYRNRDEWTPASGTPEERTDKLGISVRLSPSLSVTTGVELNGLIPAVTAAVQGNVDCQFIAAYQTVLESVPGYPTESGWIRMNGDYVRNWESVDSLELTLGFNLNLTFTVPMPSASRGRLPSISLGPTSTTMATKLTTACSISRRWRPNRCGLAAADL